MRKKIFRLLQFSFSSRAALVLFFEVVLGILVVLGSLYLFADITKDTLFDKEVVHFDAGVSSLIQSFRTPEFTKVMIVISYFGSDFLLVMATFFFILLSWKKHRKESLLFFVMLLFGALLNLALKQTFQRPRPATDALFTLTSYGFPSAHAMNGFVFYATVSYFIFRFTRKLKLSLFIALLSGVLVFFIGISRIYLGVHYATDVIAGYIAGLLWFVLLLLIEKTFVFYKQFKKYKKGVRRNTPK